MKTNDISIAFIAWNGDGKWRPIFIISERNEIISFYKITSQYQNKSAKIRQQYFPIEHWKDAGLNKPSYIDTITVGQLDNHQFHLKVIGRLTADDAKQFEQFLLRNQNY